MKFNIRIAHYEKVYTSIIMFFSSLELFCADMGHGMSSADGMHEQRGYGGDHGMQNAEDRIEGERTTNRNNSNNGTRFISYHHPPSTFSCGIAAEQREWVSRVDGACNVQRRTATRPQKYYVTFYGVLRLLSFIVSICIFILWFLCDWRELFL